jgi:CheY-like chemotaxis protein
MPTILVADDSLSVRKVAERQLTEAGLEVALVSNGEEALKWLHNRRPDLVIADVIMPDKSGFEVCAFIKSNAALADTPVILVSGFVDEEVTRQAEACHADRILKKPFQGAVLRERVLELLSARKAHKPQAPAYTPTAPGESLGRGLRDSTSSTMQALEKRLAEQEKALGQASMLIKDLGARLAETETHTAELQKRLHALEPAVASAEKLLQMLGESVRQATQTLGRRGS